MGDRIARITRTKYRKFAEIAKASGQILDLESFESMGCLGRASPMVMTAVDDATDPHSMGSEHGSITLAESWQFSWMQSANRPEIDWRAIPEEQALEFVLWHEIGHRVWNFSMIDLIIQRSKFCAHDRFRVSRCNEVLADRFAWDKVCPGEELPAKRGLTVSDREGLDDDIAEFKDRIGLVLIEPNPLLRGQYRTVSTAMLKSERWRAYVGPKAVERSVR